MREILWDLLSHENHPILLNFQPYATLMEFADNRVRSSCPQYRFSRADISYTFGRELTLMLNREPWNHKLRKMKSWWDTARRLKKKVFFTRTNLCITLGNNRLHSYCREATSNTTEGTIAEFLRGGRRCITFSRSSP